MVDKANFVDNARDLDRRITRCIYLYMGKPVLVLGVTEDMRVLIVPVSRPADEGTIIDFSDKNFSLDNFKIGYINVNGIAHFLVRGPARTTKHGLNEGNIFDQHGNRLNSRIYYSSGFEDMVAGKYPSFEEALKSTNLASGTWSSMAISRLLAVSQDKHKIILWHRGNQVAFRMSTDKSNAFNLYDVNVPSCVHACLKENKLEINNAN